SFFQYAYVNTDPHPGNYLFQPDGRIVFLDFGAVSPVDPTLIQSFQENVLAFMDDQHETFTQTAIQTYGFPTKDPQILDAYIHMVKHFLEPLHPAKQPFAFSKQWLDQFVTTSFQSGQKMIFPDGKTLPKLPPASKLHPDLRVLQRIGIGLSSLIGQLQATADWNQEARNIFALPKHNPPSDHPDAN
ncbi:MAG: AarF/UbiB family protein, partial [Myxococcota bacterium]